MAEDVILHVSIKGCTSSEQSWASYCFRSYSSVFGHCMDFLPLPVYPGEYP